MLKNITIIKPFTREIEVELFEKARKIDRVNGFLDREEWLPNGYRETLILQVLPLARHILSMRRQKPQGGAFDDWHSEALMAVVIAYDRYDHTLGFRWTSYAGNVTWKRLILWERKDRMAKRLDVRVCSKSIRETEDRERKHVPTITYQDMIDCLDVLSPRYRTIMLERLKGHTLTKIGEIHGVSKERIRQIELKCKEKLKDELRKRGFGNDFDQPCSGDPVGVCCDSAE